MNKIYNQNRIINRLIKIIVKKKTVRKKLFYFLFIIKITSTRLLVIHFHKQEKNSDKILFKKWFLKIKSK